MPVIGWNFALASRATADKSTGAIHPFDGSILIAKALLEKVEAVFSSRSDKTAGKIGPCDRGGLEAAIVRKFVRVKIKFHAFHTN